VDQATEALGRLEHGETEAAVATRLGVTPSCIHEIKARNTWKELAPFQGSSILMIEDTAKERWLPWPANPKYYVSDQGNVQGPRRKLLKQRALMERGGYMQVYVHVPSDRGLRKTLVYVHRLVLETFVGPRLPDQQCRHLDGTPANNNLLNLTWGTIADNHKDKLSHGTVLKHESHNMAKLKMADVLMIRASDERGIDLAKKFSVCQATISLIRNGHLWR
jgi:hypothetical protein